VRNLTSEETIYNFILDTCRKQNENNYEVGCDTNFIANNLKLKRANVSAIVNKLSRENKLIKIKGKPVVYKIDIQKINIEKREQIEINNITAFDRLIGCNDSLKGCILQAKAAIMYPPKGLHTLILGNTGVGKTLFAETMHRFAITSGVLEENAPFISFNCADYANNPQLLLSYLFGVKRGTYTGATEDRTGLVEKANKGILFLDEIHRLPPEGQEILFYLIDKGIYKPLGEVEEFKKVDVLIICATTEKKEKFLLSTFSRRIPMIISLPALAERTFSERFAMINQAFNTEALRINKEITVTPEAVKSLLLYDCQGNVGQLMNDIQLGCANSFLKSMVNETNKITVDMSEFPEYVRMGILNYKKNKKDIDKLVIQEIRFTYSKDGDANLESLVQYNEEDTLYNNIEERIGELKKRGLNEEDIYMVMSIDIEKYFKKYIYKITTDINKEEISKVVDEKIINIVEDFVNVASAKFHRIFTQRVFYALCFHINSSIERIKQGKVITNPKIREIQSIYEKEFKLSLNLAKDIEKNYKINIPVDEVGFITMFITEEFTSDKDYINNKPNVVIAMHGESTASSMAKVVNKLLGANNTYGYDMDLDKPTTIAYEEIKDKIIEMDNGAGVMLLVDMGSLANFGELIENETGIKVKVINMVSTLMALEVSRRALVDDDIENIYNGILKNLTYAFKYDNTNYNRYDIKKENIIITLCITGEGTAVKLKHMIEKNIAIKEKDIEIYPMSILDREDMFIKVKRLAKEKNIVAVIGSINPDLHGIPFISASELFINQNYRDIEAIIEINNYIEFDLYRITSKVIDSFKEDIDSYDLMALKDTIIEFVENIKIEFNIKITMDTAVGIIMHIISSIDRIKQGHKVSEFKEKYKILNMYNSEIEKLKELLEEFEKKVEFKFSEDEVCYIYTLIKSI
jgi:transcriptional regulatory protein LevR/transcriptional regulator with AAA-type ATPase domain